VPAGSISYNPLYLQVKEVVLKRLAGGVYAPGAVIPSEQKLAADFGTSISTVRQALSILVSDGYLVKKQGKGTFVSEKKIRISFLSWIGESKQGGEIIKELIASFERKYPSISIEYIPTTYPETRKDLLKLITNGTAPDVAQIVSHWTSYFASMGAFEPLNELLSRENIEGRLFEKDILGGTYQNKIYSVSWGLCPVSLIANRNILSEVGIDSINPRMSIEEFFDLCRRINSFYVDRDKYCYGLPISGDETDFLRIYTFLQVFHGGFVDEKEQVIFNSKENVRGFRWLRDFVNSIRVFISDIYTIRKHFARNEIAFISDGPWIKYILEELTGEDFNRNFQVLLNPVNAEEKSSSWNYNHALAICSQSKNKMYAAKFIDALTVDPEISGQYYARVGHLAVSRRDLKGPVYGKAPFCMFREQLEHAGVINAQNAMFEKAMVLCIDAVKKILFESANIEKELDEKQYYLRMLYYG
jgi:multiple sugar transport system substrate-binding protein